MVHLKDSYEKAKATLKAASEEMLDSKILPVTRGDETFDEYYLKNIIKALEENDFIISICGQIKSGKSTFLNALLFKDDILPAGSTPLTAKLTFITYGENEKAVVRFYDKDDWNTLKSDEDSFNKFYKKSLEDAFSEGIQEHHVIQQYPLKKDIEIKDLSDYVAADGLYTPFVQSVEIYVSDEHLRGVTVVDTPGTNDVNIVRARVTEKWINRSHAVVMLLPEKGVDSNDEYFIDHYFYSVPSDKILIVLNKVDECEEPQVVKDYIERYFRHGKLRERGLLKENGKVYPLSSLAALLSFIDYDKLDDTYKWYYNRISEKHPDLLDKKGYLDDLSKGIDNHLMNNSGIAVLNKCLFSFKQILKAKRENLETRRMDAETRFQSLGDKIEHIDTNRKNVQNALDEFKDIERDFIDKRESGIVDYKKRIEKECNGSEKAIDRKLKQLKQECSYEQKHEFKWEIYHSMREKFEDFNREADNARKNYVETIEEAIHEVAAKIGKRLSTRFYVPPIEITPFINLRETILEKLDEKTLKELDVSKFVVFTNEEKTLDRYYGHASEVVTGVFEEVRQRLKSHGEEEAKRKTEYVLGDIRARLKELKDSLDEARKGEEELNKEKEKNQKSLEKVNAEFTNFENTEHQLRKKLDNVEEIIRQCKEGMSDSGGLQDENNG